MKTVDVSPPPSSHLLRPPPLPKARSCFLFGDPAGDVGLLLRAIQRKIFDPGHERHTVVETNREYFKLACDMTMWCHRMLLTDDTKHEVFVSDRDDPCPLSAEIVAQIQSDRRTVGMPSESRWIPRWMAVRNALYWIMMWQFRPDSVTRMLPRDLVYLIAQMIKNQESYLDELWETERMARGLPSFVNFFLSDSVLTCLQDPNHVPSDEMCVQCRNSSWLSPGHAVVDNLAIFLQPDRRMYKTAKRMLSAPDLFVFVAEADGIARPSFYDEKYSELHQARRLFDDVCGSFTCDILLILSRGREFDSLIEHGFRLQDVFTNPINAQSTPREVVDHKFKKLHVAANRRSKLSILWIDDTRDAAHAAKLVLEKIQTLLGQV